MVFDASEKVTDFTNAGLGFWGIVTEYLQYFLLFILNLLAPFIAFLSAIWVATRMASRTENIAIFAGAVSFNRFIRPYIVGTLAIVAVLLLFSHYIVPNANYERLEFENNHTNYRSVLENKYLELEPGTIIGYREFNLKTNYVSRLSVEKWKLDEAGRKVKYYELQAHQGQGDSTTNDWKLTNVFIRESNSFGQNIHKFEQLDTTLSFKGIDLGQRDFIILAMTSPELEEYRLAEIRKGSGNTPMIEVEQHMRNSTPFSVLILVIIGICISYKKKRNGTGINLMIGLSAGALYFFASKMATVSATKAGLDPFIAAWIPNVIFGIIALIFYLKARK